MRAHSRDSRPGAVPLSFTLALCMLLGCGAAGAQNVRPPAAARTARPAAANVRIFNTAKQKLERGESIVGGTVTSPDPDIYCAMANSGFDFLWIEMQHSPLTYEDVAHMIWACRGAPAMPFIRVPDATPSDIQKATDIGALGIIIPQVEDLAKIQNAVKYAKYPPQGARSLGNGQYRALYGDDYRQVANANIVIVAMIESPAAVGIADAVAAVPGVDVVFAASTDLGSFSGLKQGENDYEAMVRAIHDATLEAGLKLGGPLAWRGRPGFTFFQAPTESSYIRLGVQRTLEQAQTGVAPTEGAER